MPHIYVLSGALPTGGSIGDAELALTTVVNVNVIGTLHLEYIEVDTLALDRVVNVNTFGELTLDPIVTLLITQDAPVVNTNTINPLQLVLLPFEPVNPETEDLLNEFDQTYPTSSKIQIDTLISELKTEGVWAKFDWYGNAYWALSEHDALLDWTQPTRTLDKVGSAFWTLGAGLSGVSPPTSNSRYKSDWNLGDGANSGAANFAFFCKITAIAAPQNGMQPMGSWRMVSGGGPITPNGSFLSLSITANSGFAGADLMNGNGNTSFAPGDGLGVWGVSHSGGSQITVKDGATLETDGVSGSATYTDPDGMSVAGSAGLAKRSFPGTQLYWGWGGALTAGEFAAIESAFQTALLPPSIVADALLINDDEDYLANAAGDYAIVDGP